MGRLRSAERCAVTREHPLSKLGRNDQCPCGSGKKVKKCHDELVGKLTSALAPILWEAEMDEFLRGVQGYVPEMPDAERAQWKLTGCPFGDCTYETAGTRCAAPNCGV